MIRRTVPGHTRAATLPIICLVGLTFAGAWFFTPVRWWMMWDIIALILGLFIIDQSTHLQQEAHSEPAPTGFERLLQDHYALSWLAGAAIVVGATLHAARF